MVSVLRARRWCSIVLWCALSGFTALPISFAATSITQFGITWTFDRDYPSGRFANGDHWVVGPVVITDISPRSMIVDGATLHGSMVNPKPHTEQGFDSRIKNVPFAPELNRGASLPLTLQPGSSLLSSASHAARANGDDPQLKTIAILTVLSAPAPAGSFRPAYVGTDKAIRWNVSQLDYGRLRSLPRVASAPDLATLAKQFEKPFIDLRSNWTSRYVQPSDNHPPYGREISHQVGAAMLALQLDATPAQKEPLLVKVVQRGLDVYGLAVNGANWGNDGGHRIGRKPMLLLAGAVLNDTAILAYADAAKFFKFQEDQQTFYVSAADVARKRQTSDGKNRQPYTTDMIGLPEWGEKHIGMPERDDSNWGAAYRAVCGPAMSGNVLAARLMGLRGTWNWPALFDYIDRYFEVEGSNAATHTNALQPFVKSMWAAYRLLDSDDVGAPADPAPDPEPPAPPPVEPEPDPTDEPSSPEPPPPVDEVPSPVEDPVQNDDPVQVDPPATQKPPPSASPSEPADPSKAARLANISTRGRAGPDDVMIAGFVLRGSAPREVLIRAVGPGLSKFGVKGALSATTLTLYQGSKVIAQNDQWSRSAGASDVAAVSRRLGAFGLSESSDDAAIVMKLAPGTYSVHVAGPKKAGVALVEVYDAGEGTISEGTPRLINISTRGHVGTNDEVMIAGLVVTGDAPKRVLIRAVGPTLKKYQVSNTLADPELELFRGSTRIAANDNWGARADLAAAATAVGAFALDATSRDAGLLVTLEPGVYSAQVRGRNGGTGTALVEVYEVP